MILSKQNIQSDTMNVDVLYRLDSDSGANL